MPVAPGLSVAFQGESGAYSERAVEALFTSARTIPSHSLREVFETVEIGAADFGVVPLENSYAGSINETYDLLVRHGLVVVAEKIVRISHSLLALDSAALEDIEVVFSHPQALDQCSEFLDSLEVERVSVHDTAGAARKVSEEARPEAAAIASGEVADRWGLKVVAANIEDRPDNSTKFVAVGRSSDGSFGPADKTSIVFATADVPGALYRCLGEFARRGLNLSKLESRPSRSKAWQYLFYLDFEGPVTDEAAQEALKSLEEHTSLIRVLGSYPRSG